MRLYLAGPITGTGDFNERFAEAREALRAQGYEVICPVEGCSPDLQEKLPWEYWMRRALMQLLSTHGVALLPGWERSSGVEIELYVATRLKMPAFTVEEWLGKEPAEQLELLQEA